MLREELDPFVNRYIKSSYSVVRKKSHFILGKSRLVFKQFLVIAASLSNHRWKIRLKGRRKEKERDYFMYLLCTYPESDAMESTLTSQFKLLYEPHTMIAMEPKLNFIAMGFQCLYLQIS